MIEITDMKGNGSYINPDHIEKMDVVPDTVLNFMNGHRYIVQEAPDEIIKRITEFRFKCHHRGL